MNRKESFYRTAKTKAEVWGIPADTYVSVQFAGFDRINVVTNQREPIYLIRASMDEPFRGHVFGHTALTEFCL